jgi:hypothetical protein
MTRRAPRTLADLPLFASDEDLGEAVLGYDRRGEFHGYAELCERAGMPKISAFWGGRYVPAVKAFLDSENGLADEAPMAPNGLEGKWPSKTNVRKLRA